MDTDHLLQASDFRRKATLGLAVVSLFLLTPFAINNFLNNRFLLGAGALLIIVILAFNAWSITRGRYSSLPTLLALVPAILFFLILSVRRQQMIGVLWCYPAILAFYIMLPERRAWIANGVLLAVVVPECWLLLEHDLAIRIAATLIAVSIFSVIFIGAISDQQRQLQTIAVTDSLTGLLNRTHLDSILEQAISQSSRSRAPMTLLALDLDHFKSINDSYGHPVGDDVLKSVGSVLKRRLRRADSLFRLGGEEFLALLFDTDLENGRRVAEELRATVESHRFLKSRSVTTSIGVATLADEEQAAEWLQRADANLYRAKENGRNRVEG